MLPGFAVFGAWRAGLAAIAISAGLTTAVRFWRLTLRTRQRSAPVPAGSDARP